MKKRLLIVLPLILIIVLGIGIKLWLGSKSSPYPPSINEQLLQEGKLIGAQFINMETWWPASVKVEYPIDKKIWVLQTEDDTNKFLTIEGYANSALSDVLTHSAKWFQEANIIVFMFPFDPVEEESFRVDAMMETKSELQIELLHTNIGTSFDQQYVAYFAILEVPPTDLTADKISVKICSNRL